MIVKILPKSATFKGVRYNTNKIDSDKGELMKVENFDVLQALEHLNPKDYINYLEARSATSSRTKYPQFHAVISCKGKSHSKEQLTDIATQWLKGMGYGSQPYLLVFHKDTGNNHIHIVSTRIDENGKKINDSYEKIRAYQVLNQVMGIDEKEKVVKDLDKALSYNFSTRAQFMMILETQGYALKLKDGQYQIFMYGKQQGSVNVAAVDARISFYKRDIDRLAQLRAITEKYRANHNPAIIPITVPLPGGKAAKPTGYTSELAELLASKFGVEVLFHGKTGMPPYGYTLLDHAQKAVYKGGDLMPLSEFIGQPAGQSPEHEQPIGDSPRPIASISQAVLDQVEVQMETDFRAGGDQPAEISSHAEETISTAWLPEISLDIADDIDDEAILGRNRQRKRKTRTNTR